MITLHLSLSGFVTAIMLGSGGPAVADCVYFSWKDPVSGDFSDGGRWTSAAPECRGIVPPPGTGVAFRQGTYTVTFPAAQTASFSEFAPAGDGTPPEFDITFQIAGSFNAGNPLATTGHLTVTGGGSLSAANYLLSPEADLIIDGASATLGPVNKGNVAPADPAKQILLRNQARLTTTGTVAVFGATVESGTWTHTGPANGFGPGQVNLTGSGRLESPAISIVSAIPVRVDGASTADIDNFTATWVELKGSGQMLNENATLTSQLLKSADGAARWTVRETMTITDAGAVMATGGGQITSRRIELRDINAFAQLFSRGAGSKVTVEESLKAGPGWVAAQMGGAISAPDIEVRGTGQLDSTNTGSLITCPGPLKIGSQAGNAASATISAGGMASAHSVAIGFSAQANSLAVDGATGASRMTVRDRIEAGKEGKGNVVVRNGGQLHFSKTITGFMSVTPAGSRTNGDGEVTVDGANSLLDLNGGSLGVGISNAGRLFVTGGGRVMAGALDVGTNFDGSSAPSLARIAGANSKVELTESARVWIGTLRVQTGGFLQVTPGGPGGNITLITPALLDLAGGSAEIGSAGPPPSGMLRVATGSLRGSGTIRGSVDVIGDGVCSPGSEESNILKIDAGAYRQEATGTLESEVRGGGPDDTDLLDVSGNVTLNGRLKVFFADGFAPVSGTSFGIVRYGGSLSGEFSSVEVFGLAPGFIATQQLIAPGLYGIIITGNVGPAVCPGPDPKIGDISLTKDGRLSLSIDNATCEFYRLEYSIDLNAWNRLQNFSGHPSGRVRLLLSLQRYLPWYYYRVVRP